MSIIFSLKKIKVNQLGGFTLSIKSLKFKQGGLYALVGENGSGKSTLLNTIALLNKPDSGEMYFNSCPIFAQKPQLKYYRRQITLVEQSPYLFDRTVYENIAFGLKIRGIDQQSKRLRILEALESVGLSGFEMRDAKQLSGGEIQRVALARALVLKPKILLLDEPTSNIDKNSLQIFENLLMVLVKQGVTIVFSTHDTLLQRRLGAEIIRLENGEIQEFPEPPPLKSKSKGDNKDYG